MIVNNSIKIDQLYYNNKQDKRLYWEIYVQLFKNGQLQEMMQLTDNNELLNGEYTAKVVINHGQVNGKNQQSSNEIVMGKNIGKKNQTNVLQQAISEANSIAKIRRRKIGIDIQLHKPLLLQKYEQKRIDDICYIQPKLNGIRALSKYDSAINDVYLYSRTFKEWKGFIELKSQLRLIQQKMYQYIGINYTLDGELFNFDMSLQKISGLARNDHLSDIQQQQQDSLKYFIFDIIINEDIIQSERMKYLIVLQQLIVDNESYNMVVCPTFVAHNHQEIDYMYKHFMSYNYEGIVVRNKNGVYKLHGKRTFDIMKYKKLISEEFKMIDYTQGLKGKDKDLIMWILQTDSGIEFTVRPNETEKKRKQLLQQFKNDRLIFEQQYKGQLVTLDYQECSDDGIPMHIKNCIIRNYE